MNHAAHRGVITVAAAGNQGTVGSSAITRHPWVIPVAACDTARQAAQRIESRKLNRQEGAERAGGERHQPRDKRQAADIWRDQRGRAFRDRRDCAALVGVSRRHRGPDQAGRDASRYATAGNHRSARPRCLGGLSGDGLGSQREKSVMNRKETTKNQAQEARTSASPCSSSGVPHRRGDRPGRRHQASDVRHGDQALRRLREARRGAQPMDAFLTVV